MNLYNLSYKLGKEKKHVIKGGTSPEDAFGKLEVDLRNSPKKPVFRKATLLEAYGDYPPLDPVAVKALFDECEQLRQEALKHEQYE